MLRFLADADLRYAIVSGCLQREPSMDFLSAGIAKLEGLPDSVVLAIAAGQERILVTHDFKTMPRHFAEFVAHNSSPGIFLVKQRTPLAGVIEGLVLIWTASGPGEWQNRALKISIR